MHRLLFLTLFANVGHMSARFLYGLPQHMQYNDISFDAQPWIILPYNSLITNKRLWGYLPKSPISYHTINSLKPSDAYMCNLTIIGSDNGLSPGRRQAIIWTNAGILLIGPPGTNFSEILIEIYTFSIKKMHIKMSSAKRRLFLLGLNVLKPANKYFYEGMITT